MLTRAFFELTTVSLLFFVALSIHTRHTAPSYKKTFATSSKSVNYVLALHILAGLYEVYQYYIRQLYGPVIPKLMDLLTCMVQSTTNLILAKPLRRGIPAITRPSYQAGAILRLVMSNTAYIQAFPELHRGSVKIVNAFLYTRFIIWMLEHTRCTGLVSSYKKQYAIAVTGAAIIAIVEGGIDKGVATYVFVVAAVVVLNWFVSSKLESLQASIFFDVLTAIGFADLHTIRRIAADKRVSSDPYELPSPRADLRALCSTYGPEQAVEGMRHLGLDRRSIYLSIAAQNFDYFRHSRMSRMTAVKTKIK